MTLDNEQQRAFLLSMFDAAQIPGAHIDFAYSVKQALLTASLSKPPPREVEKGVA
jgi:hypothetical protein